MNCLGYSTVSANIVIALEYFRMKNDPELTNKVDDSRINKAKDMLRDGLKLCDLLSEKILPTTPIGMSKLKAYKAIRQLNVSEKDLDEVVECINKSKPYLIELIENDVIITDEEIRKLQGFFNTISATYLMSYIYENRQCRK